jgi:hypothetical protein
MSDTNERSVASAGSQPVAWAVQFDGEVEPFCLSFDKGKAIDEAGGVGRVVPLYRSPTLTDAEREAIELAIATWVCKPQLKATLRGLLERLG